MLLGELRAGLVARLASVPSMAHAGTRLPSAPGLPFAVVPLPSIDFHSTMGRGCDSAEIEVQVFVSASDPDAGESQLEAFMAGHGAESVRAALENDDEVVDALADVMVVVREVVPGGEERINKVAFLTATFLVELEFDGT